MKITTVIIVLASIGFILMGLFFMYNKSISKFMIIDKDDKDTKIFIKQNAYINITVGIIGIVLGLVDEKIQGITSIIIIIFVIIIFLASLAQGILAKKYKSNLN